MTPQSVVSSVPADGKWKVVTWLISTQADPHLPMLPASTTGVSNSAEVFPLPQVEYEPKWP